MSRVVLASWDQLGYPAIHAAAARHADSLLDALEAGVAVVECDTTLATAGVGSVPNRDGDLELDASIMEGTLMRAGAVCAVRGMCPAIRIARLVMERTPHVMLAGDQAARFARDHGVDDYDFAKLLDMPPLAVVGPSDPVHHDTILMLGWQSSSTEAIKKGSVAAACATSGTPHKLPGRVGDSPIIGAGIFADDEIGCAGATGHGEDLWRSAASHRTVMNMARGMSPKEACEETVLHIGRRLDVAADGAIVTVALNRYGEFAAASLNHPFDLWVSRDGMIHKETYLPVMRPPRS